MLNSATLRMRSHFDTTTVCISVRPSCHRRQDIYGSIEIRPVRYWELLVWMDPANYGGILEQTMGTAAMRGAAATDTGKKRKRKRQLNFDDSLEPSLFEELDEASEEEEEEGEEDRDLFRTGDKLDVAVDMQWDIMGYLPQELCQEHFQLIVGTPPPSNMHAHQAPSPNGTDTQSSRTPATPAVRPLVCTLAVPTPSVNVHPSPPNG